MRRTSNLKMVVTRCNIKPSELQNWDNFRKLWVHLSSGVWPVPVPVDRWLQNLIYRGPLKFMILAHNLVSIVVNSIKSPWNGRNAVVLKGATKTYCCV